MMMRRILVLWATGYFLLAAPLASAGATDRTQEWIETLRSDASVFEKARACQQLGESGTEEAVPALAALVDHEVLSAYARAGLERIPSPDAATALRDALDRTEGKFLVGVINSIAALRDEQAVTALNALTRHSEPEVVKAALLALGRISNDATLPLVWQALISGPEAFRPDAAAACLLAAQQQLDQGNVSAAQALYDTVREAQVPASYRIGATRGAIVARKADRVAFLIRQLRSDDPAIRNVALLTIRAVPSDELATALNAELKSEPKDLQIQLLTALKDCHNTESRVVLRKNIESGYAEKRLGGLRVLASIGSSDDASVFLGVLRGRPGAEEISVAVNRLEQMEGSAVGDLILRALRSADRSETRVQLIRLLGNRNATGATDELLQQASGSDASISITAFQALKSLAGFEELPRLIALTQACRSDSVRDAAVNAVHGACKNNERVGPSAALVLKELKASKVAVEKECWIRVLTLLGYADALPTLTATLEDVDPKLVQSTISHLSRWPDPAPIEALFKALETGTNSGLRRQALMAILQLATTAADRDMATEEELMVWFRRAGTAVESAREKRLLISGLGRVHHIESVRLSASYLDDADVRIEAAYAIVSAAEPLVKGSDYQAVEAVLKKMSGLQDQRLRDRIAKLLRDIEATATESGKQ